MDREPAPDVGWQVPADTWIERHEQTLRKALADLQAALTPADEGFIREKLAVLATYKGSRAGVPAEWELRRREYVRLLDHYPADIWQDALDEWALGSRWFPDLSELNELMNPKLIERSLELSLTGAVATQDVIFLLTRMLANPAAREPTWRFVQRRWSRLYKRMPSLLASRLVESTSNLLTPAHRREVATFFARHPVPSGSRALRQSLERFDWYRGFRGRAARDLRDWIDAR
ncbi:MAG: ERAP1-like C-terminal domain-containing protein [Myxococcales bacterium]|nr:ERAP1-like C-terminal domain-containing protein [Myxococcales bacterium]